MIRQTSNWQLNLKKKKQEQKRKNLVENDEIHLYLIYQFFEKKRAVKEDYAKTKTETMKPNVADYVLFFCTYSLYLRLLILIRDHVKMKPRAHLASFLHTNGSLLLSYIKLLIKRTTKKNNGWITSQTTTTRKLNDWWLFTNIHLKANQKNLVWYCSFRCASIIGILY